MRPRPVRFSPQLPATFRYPAEELERLVTSRIHPLLRAPDKYKIRLKLEEAELAKELAERWPTLENYKRNQFANSAIKQVILGDAVISIKIDRIEIVKALLMANSKVVPPCGEGKSSIIMLRTHFQPFKRGIELQLVGPDEPGRSENPIPSLVKAVARAREWYECVVAGQIGTISELAHRSGLTSAYVKRILKCAMLSPQITERVLSGNHRRTLTLQQLAERIPIDWREQQNRVV